MGSARASLAVGGAADDDDGLCERHVPTGRYTIEKTTADDFKKTADDYRRKETVRHACFHSHAHRDHPRRQDHGLRQGEGHGENAQDTWKRVSPTPAEPDKEKFQTFVASLADIRAITFVDSKAKTGLDAPAATIVVKFDEGKKEDRVAIGQRAAPMRYASRQDDPGVAKIDPTKLDEALKSIDEFAK